MSPSEQPHEFVVGAGLYSTPPRCSMVGCGEDIGDPIHVDPPEPAGQEPRVPPEPQDPARIEQRLARHHPRPSKWDSRGRDVCDAESGLYSQVFWPCDVELARAEVQRDRLRAAPSLEEALDDRTWTEFEQWESEAAAKGSGMTKEAMTGAMMFRLWLDNRRMKRAALSDPTPEPTKTFTDDELDVVDDMLRSF